MKRLLFTIFLSCSIVLPAAAAETVDAVWKEHNVDFTFIGLDVEYSCNLMKGRIEMLLRYVGAEDVEVTVPSCAAFTTPQRQLRVIAEFSTLVPAAAGEGDIVKAAWNEVVLDKRHPQLMSDGDCQLLEQFQEYVLSSIEHQVIGGSAECSATKRSIVGQLKIRVLEPVPANAPAETDG